MTVNNIICASLSAAKFFNMMHKSGKMFIEVMFMNRGKRSSFYMYNTYRRMKLYNLWDTFVCPTGKYIDGQIMLCQSISESKHIDIHATCVFGPTGVIQGGCMNAKHGNRVRHSESAPLHQSFFLFFIADALPAPFSRKLHRCKHPVFSPF